MFHALNEVFTSLTIEIKAAHVTKQLTLYHVTFMTYFGPYRFTKLAFFLADRDLVACSIKGNKRAIWDRSAIPYSKDALSKHVLCKISVSLYNPSILFLTAEFISRKTKLLRNSCMCAFTTSKKIIPGLGS